MHNVLLYDVLISGGNTLVSSLLALMLSRKGLTVCIEYRKDGRDDYYYAAIDSFVFRSAVQACLPLKLFGNSRREWIDSLFDGLNLLYESGTVKNIFIDKVSEGSTVTHFREVEQRYIFIVKPTKKTGSIYGMGAVESLIKRASARLTNEYSQIKFGRVGRNFISAKKTVITSQIPFSFSTVHDRHVVYASSKVVPVAGAARVAATAEEMIEIAIQTILALPQMVSQISEENA
jgi:hypothetical protein